MKFPQPLSFNWDQTGIQYVPVSSWTMEIEGTKRIEVAGKDDKRQITAVFGASMEIGLSRQNHSLFTSSGVSY